MTHHGSSRYRLSTPGVHQAVCVGLLGIWKVVVDLLVEDVEDDVQKIPAEDQEQRGFALISETP